MRLAWFLLYLCIPLIKMYNIAKTNGDPFYYCMRTYNVSREQVDLFTENIDAAIDDYKLQCYVGCVLEETGLVYQCQFIPSALYNQDEMEPIHGLEAKTTNAIIEACYAIDFFTEDPCTCGYTFAKCLQGVMEA